jgi:hypothetical protein
MGKNPSQPGHITFLSRKAITVRCAHNQLSACVKSFLGIIQRHSLQSSNQRISAAAQVNWLCTCALLTAIFHASISLAINYDTRGARIPLSSVAHGEIDLQCTQQQQQQPVC